MQSLTSISHYSSLLLHKLRIPSNVAYCSTWEIHVETIIQCLFVFSLSKTYLSYLVLEKARHKHIFFLETSSPVLSWDEGCSMTTVFEEESKLDLTRTECGRHNVQQQEDKNSLRNRPLTAAQPEASLNSTNKTPAFRQSFNEIWKIRSNG